MEKILELKYIKGEEVLLFPNDINPIIITEFTYDAKRMGGVPTITASVMYNSCLDNVWDNSVFALFDGEKYFLKQTPTSSKNNTDARFKHEVSLVSERIILDNVYFYDVVSNDDKENDKPVSNKSEFSFFGTIHEFARRLHESLKVSHIDYSVIVDDDISSEGKLLSFSNTYFSNALQEAYNTFNIPYYFHQKEIHFGYTNNIPEQVFKYGVKDALLSITKTNNNQKIVNRITGVGSSDNIPYYYPNDTPKGDIDVNALPTNNHLSKDDFKIKTPEITASELLFSDKVTFEVSGIKSPLEITKSFLQDDGEYHHEDEYNTNTIRNTHTYIDGWYHHTGHVGVKLDVIAQGDGEGIVECALYLNELSPEKAVKNLEIVILENNGVDEYSYEPEITDSPLKKTFNIKLGDVKAGRKFEILIDYDITRYDHLSNDDAWYADFQAISDVSNEVITRWRVNNHKIVTLKELGIELNNNDLILNPQKYQGEGFFIEQIKYIQPQLALMPSIYRDTLGKERFLNALNGTYVQENSNAYYEFKHPYIEGRPKEHIQNFEDIKPSITNMVNSAGQRMDMFLDFAYDEDDNDEVDENGEYLHPYFFAKLPKFDGEYGFNLFDQAIEEEEMAISMTSGSCGACHWIIAVGEDTQKNVVQVDDNGNLLRGANGNVLRSGAPQERQNDTRNNEVWIALRKDIETFGVSMPSSKLKPTTNDTFVILHINMPKSYVLAAEDRLQKMLIQYMAENNSERFDFSISFSRIYFAENPEVLALINENARLTIEYNGEKHLLYISSYQYKMKGEEHLPEIIVELSDELTVSQNAIQNAVSEVKNEMLYRLGNIDWLAIGQKYFLRKDSTSDTSKAKTMFKKQVSFGEESHIEPTGDAIFKDVSGQKATFDKFTSKNGVVDIDGNADISGDANIDKSLDVTRNALIGGDAQIGGNAQINGNAEIKGTANINVVKAKSVEIGKYVDGEFGTGAKVYVDDNNSSHLIVDFATIRKKATFNEITVKELKHVGGAIILSAASGVIERVENVGGNYKCYFKNSDADGKTIKNEFVVNDLVRCQVFNLTDGSRYYWRKVIEKGTNHIVLSNSDADTNSVAPLAGDNISLFGNTTDKDRQAAIIISAYGDNTPSITYYQGVNSFDLTDKKIRQDGYDKKTQRAYTTTYGDSYVGARDESSYMRFTPEDGVEIKGKLHIESGSTGAEQLVDFGDTMVNNAQRLLQGKYNLLRNSGFTGDFVTEILSEGSVQNPDSEMFSPPLDHWVIGSGSVVVNDSAISESGKEAYLASGTLSQTLNDKLIKGETYIFSLKAHGAMNLAVRCYNNISNVASSQTFTITEAWQKHIFKFVAEDDYTHISIYSGDCTICELQLERGNVPSAWGRSFLDNQSNYAYYQSLRYLASAMADGSTDILGGLILTSLINLGNYKDGKLVKSTAGTSGIYNEDDDVAFWAGGSLEQAIALVSKIRNGKTPATEEWANLAKYVVTHGGDAILKGVIYADGGYFRGRLEAKEGYFNGKVDIANEKILLNEDGSGHLANRNIEWNTDGDLDIEGYVTAKALYRGITNIRPYALNNEPYYYGMETNDPVMEDFIVIADDQLWQNVPTIPAPPFAGAPLYIPNPENYKGKEILIRNGLARSSDIDNKNINIRITTPSGNATIGEGKFYDTSGGDSLGISTVIDNQYLETVRVVSDGEYWVVFEKIYID